MAEPIGNLYETAIPSLSDTADIQEALRIYHYGAPTGSGQGKYPITNTDPTNLVNPSIAYSLFDLQKQITSFETGLLPSSWTVKGTLITASEPGVLIILTPGPNGQVLTTNSATAQGLEWKVPDITLTNIATITNKTFSTTNIDSTGLRFRGSSMSFVTTLTSAPTSNQTVTLPNATTTLVGTDTTQTLTNKTIGLETGSNIIQGTLAIENGGTNASSEAAARANLRIFLNTTSSPFSGKIYVANPATVGSTGANIVGAAAGDLWFW
jgi:hypothetical protein